MLGILVSFYVERILPTHSSYIAHLHLKKKVFFYLLFSKISKGQDLSMSMRQHSFQFFKILNYMQTSKGWKRKGNVFSDLCSKNA